MKLFTNFRSLIARKVRENYTLKFTLRKLGIEWPFYPSGHFYSTIPKVDEVLENDVLFESAESFEGIDLNLDKQFKLLQQFTQIYKDILFKELKTEGLLYHFDNPFFSYSDGVFLHCLISHFNPHKIIEIGSGYSTACMLDTVRIKNLKTKITTIDPEMDRLDGLLKDSKIGKVDLNVIIQKIQDVDRSLFTKLEANDLLFIDSSHVSKAGSELNYLLFEILPLLNKGVIIHFHDVFHNFQYPKEWIKEGIHFNEQYLLRAFLQYNESFDILLYNSFLERAYKEWMSENMPLCLKPHERYAFGKDKGDFIPHIKGQSLYIIKK